VAMPLPSRKRSWSAEDDARLRAHIAKGGSAGRAAVMLKRSDQSVRTRAAELGLKFPTIRELRARATGQQAAPPSERFMG
jgi:hypothetical protein